LHPFIAVIVTSELGDFIDNNPQWIST